MRASMIELAARYQRQTGTPVTVESDEVRILIDRLTPRPASTQPRPVDLFVTHDPFLSTLVDRHIQVSDVWTAASVRPIIAVPKGNPRQIRSLYDLARPGLRVGLTDARNAISGLITARMLELAGIKDQVYANVTRRTLQGREIADALLVDQVDACIVWNVVVYERRDRLDAIDIPDQYRPQPGPDSIVHSPTLGRLELDYVRVNVATLAQSQHLDAARDFARFVASPEGRAVFQRNGFAPANLNRPAWPRD
jgi:molybdate transport system substrate-binding protein